MEREEKVLRIKTVKELRDFIKELLIEHAEKRASALITNNTNMFYYEQGWNDALKTVRDAVSKEGLFLYRYVVKERREEDNANGSYQ